MSIYYHPFQYMLAQRGLLKFFSLLLYSCHACGRVVIFFCHVISGFGQARTAMKFFSSPDGDHLTLVNVYRASDEFLEKRTVGLSKEKNEKILRKWCKENFINSRSLRHARDIHRLTSYYPCQVFICVSYLYFPELYQNGFTIQKILICRSSQFTPDFLP